MSDPPHDQDERQLTILYATEQGNAKEYAERIARQCRHLHFAVSVCSIDEYELVSMFLPSVPSYIKDHLRRMIFSRPTS
jgi:sulfite reductase alpha subunit-like flavoprotein